MAGILLGVAFAVAFAALLLNRRIREMMAARKKPLRLAGVGLLVLSFLMLVPGLSLLPQSAWPALVNTMPFMVLTAIALIMIPGAAEQMPANEAEARAAMDAVRSVKFSGLREAAAAIAMPFVQVREAAKAAAVWILLGWVWLAGSYWLIRAIEVTGQGALGPGLAALAGFAILVSLGFAAVAVAWHRRLLRDMPVSWLRLDGAVFGYFGRLWVAAFLLGALDRMASGWGPGIAATLRLPEGAVMQALPWLIGAVSLLIFANFSLVLPARAVGATARISPFSVVANRLPWFSVGFVLTLAPFVAAIWLSNSFFPDTGDAVATLEVLLNLTLMFAAVIAGATYLSHAYVAAETALAS